MSKEASIEVKVKLDENNVPVHIEWTAEDGGKESQPSKAMMLNFWDGDTKTAARFDLWTKEMTVDEMKMFFHQTLVTMADTFERATGEEKIVGDMRDFCHWFGDKMGVLPPEAE